MWAISNFYFSILGGGIGALYESYLVLIGKVFKVETVPIIPKIRGFNAGYIFSIGLIFVSTFDTTLFFLQTRTQQETTQKIPCVVKEWWLRE